MLCNYKFSFSNFNFENVLTDTKKPNQVSQSAFPHFSLSQKRSPNSISSKPLPHKAQAASLMLLMFPATACPKTSPIYLNRLRLLTKIHEENELIHTICTNLSCYLCRQLCL